MKDCICHDEQKLGKLSYQEIGKLQVICTESVGVWNGGKGVITGVPVSFGKEELNIEGGKIMNVQTLKTKDLVKMDTKVFWYHLKERPCLNAPGVGMILRVGSVEQEWDQTRSTWQSLCGWKGLVTLIAGIINNTAEVSSNNDQIQIYDEEVKPGRSRYGWVNSVYQRQYVLRKPGWNHIWTFWCVDIQKRRKEEERILLQYVHQPSCTCRVLEKGDDHSGGPWQPLCKHRKPKLSLPLF